MVLRALLTTVCFLAGIVLVSFGAWLAYEPAGYIVAGLALVILPVLYVRGTWASSTA